MEFQSFVPMTVGWCRTHHDDYTPCSMIGTFYDTKINCLTKSLMFCSKVSFDKNSFVSTSRTPTIRKRGVTVAAGFGDGLRKFLDDIAFENWAPRSSRTWRLSLPPKQRTEQSQTKSASFQEREALWDSLEQEVQKELENSEPMMGSDQEDLESSFMGSTDEEVNESLQERIEQIASNESDITETQTQLTGVELRRLIFEKYKRTYDVSFARRDIWGKTHVSLNIMWSYLEQGSFPMSEAQLMEKYENTATYLNTWQQANQVRAFLTSPPKAKGGLPSRPIIGIAVSFQLDLPPHILTEWFGRP